MNIPKTGVSVDEKPTTGFSYSKQGYVFNITYILDNIEIDNSIIENPETEKTEESTRYKYSYYTYTGSISSYEELITILIHLRYSIDDELSLVSKGMLDLTDKEYTNYRDYVNECKTTAKNNYEAMGLSKKSI